jgi:hypothetical protein
MLTPQTIKVVQNKGMRPEMINSGKMISTTQIISILITRLKRPKVIILKGKVTRFTMGLIKKFINPRTNPDKIRYFVSPLNSTPGINLIASQKLRMPPAA